MADVYRKAKLGYEDIQFDTTGAAETAQTLTSKGTYRTVQKINASHVPISVACRAKKQASGAAVGTTEVDGTLVVVLDDLEDLGQPDGTTLENSAGTLRVKDGGLAAAKLATDSVTTVKILADNVTNAKLAANAVSGSGTGHVGDNVIEALSIGTADLNAQAVTAAKIADATITNTQIANTTIKQAKMADAASHYIFKAGTASLAGGAAFEAEAVAGVLATDIVTATPRTVTTADCYLKTVVPTADTLTFTFFADPGASTVDYVVHRAVSV